MVEFRYSGETVKDTPMSIYARKQKEQRMERRARLYKSMEELDLNAVVECFKEEPGLSMIRKSNGDTLLHVLCRTPATEDNDEKIFAMMNALYAWGVDFNTKNNDGKGASVYLDSLFLVTIYERLGGNS